MIVDSEIYEQTINEITTFKGVGIHSGKETTLTCIPKTKGGICFVRTDLNNQKVLVHPKNILGANRASILIQNNVKIITPEHLLSALYGLEIDHLDIEINQEEVPILDGSSLEFINSFLNKGIKKLTTKKKLLKITSSITLKKNDTWIKLSPTQHDYSTINYTLSYPNHFIKTQVYETKLTPDKYCKDIAPARTYGFEKEIKDLLEKGLAKGGSIHNAVIIGKETYLNKLRFENECVKHKILDLIGDFSIIGYPICAHIEAYKSGHALNLEAVQKIYNSLNIQK